MWVLFAWPNLLTVRQHSMLSVGIFIIFTRAATIWPWKKCIRPYRPSSKYFVTEYFATLSNYLKAMLLIDTVSIPSGMRQTRLTLQLPFSQWLLADLSRPVLRMAVNNVSVCLALHVHRHTLWCFGPQQFTSISYLASFGYLKANKYRFVLKENYLFLFFFHIWVSFAFWGRCL